MRMGNSFQLHNCLGLRKCELRTVEGIKDERNFSSHILLLQLHSIIAIIYIDACMVFLLKNVMLEIYFWSIVQGRREKREWMGFISARMLNNGNVGFN